MSDRLYIVQRIGKSLTPVMSGTLSAIGVKERQELQEWIVQHPQVLGEELLVLSKEFNQFEQSRRRIDILALDKLGKIVVIELKLELEGTFADLQALRYAAFCSSMTKEDVITAYSKFHGCSGEAAQVDFEKFLGPDSDIVIDRKPRIILAASSMDDQELTSTVLWLRAFGVDITCIELVPFYIEEKDLHILYPKTVVPLPETRDFQIRMERQEASQKAEQKMQLPYEALWTKIKIEYDKLKPILTFEKPSQGYFQQLSVGLKNVHYEWQVYQRPKCIRMSVHFESDDPVWNLEYAMHFVGKKVICPHGEEMVLEGGQWGKTWARASLEVPYTDTIMDDKIVFSCAELMDCIVTQTKKDLETLHSTILSSK